MGELDWDWLGIGSLLLAAMALVLGVARGEIKLRLKLNSSLQDRVASYPLSARATIIPGHSSGRWKLGLGLILTVAMAFLMPYLLGPGAARVCQQLGLAETARWLLFAVFPGVPLLVGIPLGFVIVESARILRGGYAPPLTSRPAFDTIAVAGWRATTRGLVGLLLMPVLLALVAYHAFQLRQIFAEAATHLRPGAQCPAGFFAPRNNPRP